MTLMKYIYIILVLFLGLSINAQEYDGDLQFVGRNFYNNKPLNNTKIKVVSGNTVISETSTKDNNNFKTRLEFGKVYDIYLINPNCQSMYIRVFADGVPENKRHYKMTYALDIPFFLKDPEHIDTAQFTKQFHQIVFDGKSRFVDDTVYMNKFIKNIYKKETIVKKDTTVPFITTEKLKEYIQLAGKLSLDNDKQTPLKNKTVTLVNKKGEVISTSQTTNHGVFVFKGVDAEQADEVSVNIASADNPNKDKIKLQNSSLETVGFSSTIDNLKYTFKNNGSLIDKLKDQDFDFNIAGKLIATNGELKKIGSNKTVYLLNNKNNIIQKTKTNVLGTFLFSNIKPDESYSIAYDSADAELNFIMNLYSVKDKFIRRLDSVSGKKFIYRFLAVTGSEFNDLVMDDSELKMNIKGKLYGDNKNNPLADLKVL
jgi:hypothetical protein